MGSITSLGCVLLFYERCISMEDLKLWCPSVGTLHRHKQIPLSDEAYSMDSYIVVYNPGSGLPEIFQQAVLSFGSVASVTAFLRCALGIWHIGSRLLKLMRTSYFDDFLSITTKNLTRHTEICISTFFHLLGWDLSTDKLVPL